MPAGIGALRRAPRARTLYHESAHGITALGLRLGVERISVVPDDVSAGRLVLAAGTKPVATETDTTEAAPVASDEVTSPNVARVCAAVWLAAMTEAGPIGARLALGEATPGSLVPTTGSDDHLLDRHEVLVLKAFDVPGWCWRPGLQRAVEEFLIARWDPVETLASALLERGELSGAEARALIGDVPAPDLRGVFGAIAHFAAEAAARAAAREAGR